MTAPRAYDDAAAGVSPASPVTGSARDAAAAFPANVNVVAALSLAGIGPDRTTIEIWADPAVTRNCHQIKVESDSASFTMSIENIPSENPKTGRITAVDIDTDDIGSFAWRRDSKGIVASVVQKARYWLYAVSLDGNYRRFTDAGLYGILRAAGLLFFTGAGCTRTATVGEDGIDPARSVPRSVSARDYAEI